MARDTLYNVAKRYVEIIERMERTHDAATLHELEEQRIMWHNRLLDLLNREGIKFKDRDHVTTLALQIVKGFE